jgi:hypothetical protein
MSRRKQETNEQFVARIMKFSQHGALMQLFVLDALGKMADKVAESTPADYPENCFVHPESWIGVAKELQAALNEHLGRAVNNAAKELGHA